MKTKTESINQIEANNKTKIGDKTETLKLTLSKEIYTKNAVILTVYDFLDEATTMIDNTETDWIIVMKNIASNSTLSEDLFIKRLNENAAREIINDRTGRMREATYMACVTKRL